MTDLADTRSSDLLRAVEIAKRTGLRYIYAGNLPGKVHNLEDTRCTHCSATLVKRYSYLIEDYHITAQGTCPSCGTAIPGRWAPKFSGQITSHPFSPHRTSRLVTIASRH